MLISSYHFTIVTQLHPIYLLNHKDFIYTHSIDVKAFELFISQVYWKKQTFKTNQYLLMLLEKS